LVIAGVLGLSLAQENPCNDVHSEGKCMSTQFDGEACVWCSSKAVASVCVSSEQSSVVPPAVFHCDKSNDDVHKEEKVQGEEIGSSKKKQPSFFHHTQSHEFEGKPGIEYNVNANHHVANDDAICDGSSKSISGYMDITGSKYDENGQNKHLFFWMFEKRPSKEVETTDGDDDDDETIPFIVWLTGGPGCSSTLALLSENGPCKVNKDGEGTTANPNSWTESAHVLWLDQPAGVGFSYGDLDDDKNEEMISEDAYYFLQAFFKTYPKYLKSPLYIVGESYGGHYTPAIAHRIFVGNQDILAKQEQQKEQNNLRTTENIAKKVVLNLSGIGIGNGLTKPEEQYKWYPDMMFNNSHHIELINEKEYHAMKDDIVPRCTELIHTCNNGESVIDKFACQTAFLVCNAGLTSPYQMTGLNPYDIRIKCAVPPLCYDFSNVKNWLNLDTVQKALNVHDRPHQWESCDFGINMKFREDWMKDFSKYVKVLLNAGIPALIYAGDVDFICNYLGNKAWSLELDWDKSDEFKAAGDHDWESVGLARTNKLFTFLQVYDAGHMVPSDQPEVALNMITNFINGGTF